MKKEIKNYSKIKFFAFFLFANIFISFPFSYQLD